MDVRVRAGQVIAVYFEDDERVKTIKPYNRTLDIRYEDEDLWILDKPFGIASIASKAPDEMTIENALYAHMGCPSDFVYRPVNRLDRGTGGLMVVAKNANSQYQLQNRLHTDYFIREYYAVTDGIPQKSEGVIDLPIIEPETGVKRTIGVDGRESITEYRVIAASADQKKALVELRLKTGRTHQIRIHLSAIGCPVHGDYLYGSADEHMPHCFALYSHRIKLEHPFSHAMIHIDTGIPDVFRKLLSEEAEDDGG